MKQFIQRYGRSLLILPIAAVMAVIFFWVAERLALTAHPGRHPDEAAHEHPPIPPRESTPEEEQATMAPQRAEKTDGEEEHSGPAHLRPVSWVGIVILLIPFAIAIVAIVLSATSHLPTMSQQPVPGGDPGRGQQAIAAFGCGSCHTIAGVPGANGKVGPALDSNLPQRSFIAGKLPNTPDNLIRWIMDPQGVTPGTDMPNVGIPEQSARDIAAYLYSLR